MPPPVIAEGDDLIVTMSEDGTPTAFSLTLNMLDANADADAVTWSVSSAASHGTASASGTGASKAISYVPAADYSGTDSFVVQAADSNGRADSIEVIVVVNAVNDAPVIAEGDSTAVTMSEDGAPTAFSLTLNASDADDDTVTWSVSSAASNGTASVSGTGASKAISYAPSANFNGSDSFVVQVADGNGGTDSITVNVTVNAVNDAPVVTSTAVTAAAAGQVYSYTFTGTDADGDTLTKQGITVPAWLSFNASTGVLSGTPAGVDAGDHSVTLRLSDGTANTDQTLTITVVVLLEVVSTSPSNNATGVSRTGDITASFSTNLYTSGYSSWLTLNNSATGTVALSGDELTFTPTGKLKILTEYTATVPSSAAALLGDTLGADYTWSFTTADGAWGTAGLVENSSNNAYLPQVASDSNGNAIAVWYQYDGTSNSIYANRFDGTTWGTAELIESNSGAATNPQVAVDPNGNAIAVWHQYDGTRNNIWANRFDGTTWGTAELLETDNSGSAYYPQVAFDSNGNAIAVWHQYDGTSNSIYANRFDGTTWGVADLIETDSGNAERPQVAFDSNGNAIAVWFQYDGIANNIWANRFDGTTWGTAELIETDSGSATYPQVAFGSNGNAIAVWHQYDGARHNIWANRFDGTTWGTAELIETDNVGAATDPQIAVDPSGNAIAVWYQYDGTRNNIWANRFDGTTWGTAELLETDNSGSAYYPQVAVDPNGNAIAVWQQYDGSYGSIYANRFNGTSWGMAELLETDSAGDAADSQVALDSNGSAIAVWRQHDGASTHIQTNRFD